MSLKLYWERYRSTSVFYKSAPSATGPETSAIMDHIGLDNNARVR
ncbi:hypothetical protein D1AOALGA4SA_9520 [Olavius algarvensis Delta 1 endosymbiont]|nr:hypothetical protein D1AOALGA4SA_9520 [Olavius algarvensis Delta 1 endosymbiont]